MKILLLNAYFQPEQIAFTHLEKDLLEAFSEKEYEVDIITPLPTRGVERKVRKQYFKLRKEFLYGGYIRVHRFWAPNEGRHPISRALRYFWCNLREYQIAKRFKDVDVVLAYSTPPTQGLVAGKVKNYIKKHGNANVRFIYNLQDIFPDSAVNAGLFQEKSVLYKVGRLMEDSIYQSADCIIVISKKCENNLLRKAVPIEKIKLISNWIDISTVNHVDRKDNKLMEELSIEKDKFLVVYAGNMGEAQGVEVIVKAAEILKFNTDISFILFGGGAKYNEVKQKVQGMSNIKVFPLMGQDRISEVYSLGDVALITCRRGTGGAGLPSKLWSIMACETYIVASFDVDSDLNTILTESGCGKCVYPGDAEALADMLQNVYKQNAHNNRVSSAKDYVVAYANKDICVEKYCSLLKTSNCCKGE